MTRTEATITPDDTVNQVIARRPECLPILHARGIDACCGGALPLRVVAERHGFDLDELVDALSAAATS